MANYNDQGYNQNMYADGGQNYNYNPYPTHDPNQMQFSQFDYAQQDAQWANQQSVPSAYPQLFTPQAPNSEGFGVANKGPTSFEDEPPLLEELGINFDHIFQRTLAVLNPMKESQQDVVQDTDLAGPLVFCLAFGGTLLLSGKLHFGYIYGLGLVGCMAMYALLNLMSAAGVSVVCVISTLGYCLLPMCLLSASAIILSLKGIFGICFTTLVVIWCSASASKLFVTALTMDHQQILVAYPCALVYGIFALLTVF